MKMQQPEAAAVFPPHLKGSASFRSVHLREFAGAAVFFIAACSITGAQVIFNAMLLFLTLAGGQFTFQALGFFNRPRLDISIIYHALLVILFLPAASSAGIVISAGLALSTFYYFSGGRPGYVIPPVCLTLGFLKCLGSHPQFILAESSLLAAAIVFILWFLTRFPKTQSEIQKIVLNAVMVPLLCLLHDKPLALALLWSAVAGEIIFDKSLSPLSLQGRVWHGATTLALFALLVSGTFLEEAMILTGLASGFFSAWIEDRFMARKV